MATALRQLMRGIVLLMVLGSAFAGRAQEQRPAAAPKTAPGTESKAPLEQQALAEPSTGESLSYIGKKLWFETRRRLNLTTEAEEQDQRVAERNYKLRIGGIKVERPAAVGTKP